MSGKSDDFGALKERVRLSDHVSRRLKLSKNGPDRWGLCPFHSEKSPSFSVNDAKGFYHCFGCGAHGDILDWWQRIEGLSFDQAAERLRREAEGPRPSPQLSDIAPDPDSETLRKQVEARAIWEASRPVIGTIAEIYLREARGISLSPPACLRFHPRLAVGPRDLGEAPAMVAAVTDLAGRVVAIQRTFLLEDGGGKARFERPKRALGPVGQGAVCLGPAGAVIGIAEGVETGLSAMEMFCVPVWCALGSNLSRIALPPVVRNVALFADRGEAGERAAAIARRAFHEQGRKVVVRFAQRGKDFNDELKARRHGS
jgi:DNA primase